MDENYLVEPIKIKNNNFKKIVTKLKSICSKKYNTLKQKKHADKNKTKELPPPVYPKS
tara:strand:+ start:53 stop:226 length:174 start_codon:yes stop_codon:yes gene_type:complete